MRSLTGGQAIRGPALDLDGPVVVEPERLRSAICEACPGVEVVAAADAARAIVCDGLPSALAARAAGVPFLVAADDPEVRRSVGDYGLDEHAVLDVSTLPERLGRLLESQPVCDERADLVRRYSEARAWLAAIRAEEVRVQRHHLRRERAGLERLSAELEWERRRAEDLRYRLAVIEGSRSWRLAMGLQRGAVLARRLSARVRGRAAPPEWRLPMTAPSPPVGHLSPPTPVPPPQRSGGLPPVDLVTGPEATPGPVGGVAEVRVWRTPDGRFAGSPGRAPVVAFLDPDARLASAGLWEGLRVLWHEDLDAVLTAERGVGADAWIGELLVRPPWSLVEARAWGLASGLTLVRRGLLERVGLREEAGWDAPHDLLLRAGAARIGSVAAVGCLREGPLGPRRPRASLRGVLADDLERRRRSAALGAREDAPGAFRARRRWSRRPRVTAIVPTRDAPDLLEAVLDGLAETRWRPLEVVLVDNGTRDARALDIIRRSSHRVVRSDMPFNYSGLVNLGAAQAHGEVLLLLNNDLEVRDPDWVEAMADLALEPDVGPVGALLLFPNGAIQHCGISLSNGVPYHPLRGVEVELAPPRAIEVQAPRLAVSAACMAVGAELFSALDGLDPLLRTSYNDVDLCLRAATRGQQPVYTPDAALVHHESASRGRDPSAEVAADWLLFRSRWAAALAAPDPWWPGPSSRPTT